MLKIRVIPVLTFNGIALVKTKQFANPRMVGNPIQAARVYNARKVDELVFVDIFASQKKRKLNLQMTKRVIDECYMPVSVGGGIESIKDIHNLMQIGADKVVIKTSAIKNPSFIKEAASIFGSQAIVVAVDIIRKENDLLIHHYDSQTPKIKAIDFIKKVEDLGAGELVVNDVQNDGLMAGFDADLFEQVQKNTTLPIISAGGGGKPTHFSDLLSQVSLTGVGASSIFHFTQYTPFDIKHAISEIGKPVRLFDYHLSNTANK